MTKNITLEDVEKFLGADRHAAEEGSCLAVEVADDAIGRIDDLKENIQGLIAEQASYVFDSGCSVERDRVLRLWYAFHSSLRDLDLANALTSVGQAQRASLQLGYAIATGQAIVDMEYDHFGSAATESQEMCEGPLDQGESDVDVKSPDCVDCQFLVKLVGLMAKAGTKRDGSKAVWTIEEINYGLMVAIPNITTDQIDLALKHLKERGVVTSFKSGKAGIVLYTVCDDYAGRLKQLAGTPENPQIDEHESILKDLSEILQSNFDTKGRMVPHSLNALTFALRDRHPGVDVNYVEAALTQIEHCREIGENRYLWTKAAEIPVDAVFVSVSESPDEGVD